MTIALQPAVLVPSGAKLIITLSGRPLVGLPSTPLTSAIFPSQGVTNIISSSRVKPFTSSEIEFVFGTEISANTPLILSFGTFNLPASTFPGIDVVDAAVLDAFDSVIAASSQGSFPAIFSTVISGSYVNVSSSVANAADVSVYITFNPPEAFTRLKLSGLTFVEYSGASGTRRLLQQDVSCTNLVYAGSGAFTVAYIKIDGEMTLTFPGGSASRIDPASPCVCQISGFRNSAASAASPGILVTTYDFRGAGSAIQAGIVFPPILCEPGYLQSTTAHGVNCNACPKGTYSEIPGSTQCMLCPTGSYGNSTAAASSASCILCPPATFSSITGAFDASTCIKCPPGTNSSFSGAAECVSCAAGSYAESYGQQLCSLCKAGSYGLLQRASSKSVCNICPAGTFSPVGSQVCLRCPPGTTSEEGSERCLPCSAGTYSDVGGECFKCPGITFSLKNGSTSLQNCTGILVDVGGSEVAYNLGVVILVIYILSFSLVPSWSTPDTIMRFQLTADFEGRVAKRQKTSNTRRGTTWLERVSSRLTRPELNMSTAAAEKRFFEIGDRVLWQGREQDPTSELVIGTIESTSVYPEQDADELGDFVVFVKIDKSFATMIPHLQAAADTPGGEKPVLVDSRCRTCRCQLKKSPASHARLPLLGWVAGRWEIMRQINACFQLLLMSLFPAIDTISDLIYILSSLFANYYIFAASLICITSQFWLYVNRLKQRRVFEAFKERRIDLDFLKDLSIWPKWASPYSLPVYLTMILPIQFCFHVIFPIFWFLLGYAIYSFQLFPISRISNRWLYAFV
jgi:hypothetical protein